MKALLCVAVSLLLYSYVQVFGQSTECFQDSDISSFRSLVDLELRAYAHELASNDTGVAVCQRICKTDVTWAWPQSACTQGTYETVDNMICPSGTYSLFYCSSVQANPTGYRYPGVCGCPNYCTNSTGNGNCVSGACDCNTGWKGSDCSSVTQGNVCSYRGDMVTINGMEACQCSYGSGLSDCSASVGPLPPVLQTVPSTQYTSEDDYGNDHPIFNETTIATIRLTMDEAELAFMQDPLNSDTRTYLPASFWFYNGVVSQVYDKIGFRIKGGASRTFSKKSWKLSFNEYEAGQKFAQQSKLSLKAMQMDPSATREKLCIGLLYSMNAVVQRGSYAEVYINDQFMGMYMMLEDIGNQFLKSRFGNDDGKLYKCTGDMAYLGSDPGAYANLTCGDSPCYKPETDEADDYTELAEFMTVINMTDSDFAANVEDIFDVDLFIRTLVMEVATGNWDGIWDCNNYFLYYNLQFNKFQYFRQDLDIAFGTFDNRFQGSSRNIYTWYEGGRGYRLTEKVMGVPEYRQAFTDYFYMFMDAYYKTNGALITRENRLSEQVTAGILKDYWRIMDMSWEYYETRAALSVPINRPTTGLFYSAFYGPYQINRAIFPFMRDRLANAAAQLDSPSWY